MLITSASVCAPVVHVRDDGQLFVAAMDYTNKRGRTLRHIQETVKNGTSVMETLADGSRREGAKNRDNFRFELLSSRPIHIEFGRDERHPGGTHMKPVFPVFVPEDMLRDYEQPDDDDPDEIHGPIKLWAVRDLIKVTHRRTIPFHFRTTLAVVEWAASRREVFLLYEDLLEIADHELFGKRPTQEQADTALRYMRIEV